MRREPSLSRVTEISESVSQFHQTLRDGLEGVGGGEPYSKPSQQVEVSEVTGKSFPHHGITTLNATHGATMSDL